jgi:hypothetical protein
MKEKIIAVSNDDLDGFIRSLGLSEKLANGLLSCYRCGVQLSRQNIGCIYPMNREIRLCCNSLECLQQAIDETSPSRKSIGVEKHES